MWRAKLCGGVGGNARWQLGLDGEDPCMFSKLVALGCGASVTLDGPGEVVALGRMADRYQVEAVQCAAEDAAVSLLTVESCGRVLASSWGSGLVRAERASRGLALREFDEFAKTAGFMELGEEVLGSLLEEDGLRTEAEERVFEGVVRWMKGGDGGAVRGEGLLRKIRFPFMEAVYLPDHFSLDLLPDECGLHDLLIDDGMLTSMPRRLWGTRQLLFLDPRAANRRQSEVGGLRGRRGAEARGWSIYLQRGAHGDYLWGAAV